MSKPQAFLDALSQTLVVCVPKKNAPCEDSLVCRVCDSFAMTAVFDGCGGLGGRHYEEFGGHTGAYIAARAAAKGCEEHFDGLEKAFAVGQAADLQSVADGLRAHMADQLNRCVSASQSRSALKGSLQKSFPTTVAACFSRLSPDGGGLISNILWAGDSRCFWLDDRGLFQLTIDDNDQPDALANIHEDAALTNVVSASGEYELHEMCLTGLGKGILLAATDGCFGYYPTPMHFEYLLLETLCASSSVEEWQEKISQGLAEVSGDDATLVAQICKFGTFKSMQSYFKRRLNLLTRDYIDKFEEEPACAPALWAEYGLTYNMYLENING